MTLMLDLTFPDFLFISMFRPVVGERRRYFSSAI
jgi:hypothetical protein